MTARHRSACGALLLAGAVAAAQAAAGPADASRSGSPRLCAQGVELSAAQKDRRLRLAAAVRELLERSGQHAALIARSGVDLSRFGQRYSHAGVTLRDSPNTPWSVRQLYYACDEGRPRLFDQGLAGFLLAADDAPSSHVWVLLLPDAEARALESAALDRQRSLRLLAGSYSANAHAFSTRHQNCNQWVAELLAVAWGPTPAGRAQAQTWLRARGYEPHRFDAGSPLLVWLSRLVPLLHHDDHPAADLDAAVMHVSMPESIEHFVRRRVPGARRVELCQDERHIVVRHGWQPLGSGCDAAAGDLSIAFADRTAASAAAGAAPVPGPGADPGPGPGSY